LKAYLSIFRLRFAVQLQYRAAAAAAFFTNFFFGFVRVMVFQAFYATSAVVQPLTLEQAVTYTWLGQVTFRMQPWNTDAEIMAMIRSGNVAYELCRPLDIYFVWFWRLVAMRLVPTLLTGLPILVIGLCLPAGFRIELPESVTAGAAALISIILALFLGCALSSLIEISTLWTIAGDGMQRILPAVVMVLSGSIIPLAYFPDWAQLPLRLLPFSGLVDTPLQFFIGTLPASKLFYLGLLQLGWTIMFIVVGVKLMSTGMRRIVIQGG
jgi:ABC-2 type transport system permease protein